MVLHAVELAGISCCHSSFLLAKEGILYTVVHVGIVDEDRLYIHQSQKIQVDLIHHRFSEAENLL
jgi:hypothetical protein